MRGEQFWIGTQPDPKDRRVIEVGAIDAGKIREVMESPLGSPAARVLDLVTQEFVQVQRAECGLGCACALDFSS